MLSGAIPGELVEAEIRFRKRRTWFADAVRIVEPSPDRVVPPCRYVPECGGCQLQHVTYARQLALKRSILADALRRQSVDAPDIRVAGVPDPWRYRWRGEFHVVRGANGVADAGLGFNRARSWRPIAVDDCLIHHRLITDSLPLLREMVQSGARDDLNTLHLTVGDGGAELLVRGKPRAALPAAATDAAAMRMQGSARMSTEATTLTWRGHTYRVAADTFMQVNVDQLDALYDAALTGLQVHEGDSVVDAYAGIGMLAVHLALQGARVTCIESNRAAARLGVLNARLNNAAERVTYVAAPVEKALATAADRADRLLLDPPRAGCSGEVTGWIALAGPPRVVYVSCDPATLARDLHVLVASGPYTITDLVMVDMFPQTYHLETVVTLERDGG